MSHTNTTTNYGLPQFLSSDKPAWMADINVAFADIDSQMKTNADAASAAQTTANDAILNGAPGYSNLSTYSVGDVVNYLGRVYKCDIAVTTPEAFDNAKWSYYRLSDASSQLDVIDSEIGNTDISGIGDGSITGAISTMNSNLSEDVTYTVNMPTGSVWARKNNHGVNIRCFATNPLQTLGTTSNYAAIGTLPSNMRPQAGETWLKYIWINGSINGQLRIGDDGVIKFGYTNANITTSDYISINETFIN